MINEKFKTGYKEDRFGDSIIENTLTTLEFLKVTELLSNDTRLLDSGRIEGGSSKSGLSIITDDYYLNNGWWISVVSERSIFKASRKADIKKIQFYKLSEVEFEEMMSEYAK